MVNLKPQPFEAEDINIVFRRRDCLENTHSLNIKINYPDKTQVQLTTCEIHIYIKKKKKTKLILGDQEKSILQGRGWVHSRTLDTVCLLLFKCTGFKSRKSIFSWRSSGANYELKEVKTEVCTGEDTDPKRGPSGQDLLEKKPREATLAGFKGSYPKTLPGGQVPGTPTYLKQLQHHLYYRHLFLVRLSIGIEIIMQVQFFPAGGIPLDGENVHTSSKNN